MVDGSKASKCTLDFSALNFSFLISVHVVQSYAVSDNIKEMITTLPEYHGGGGGTNAYVMPIIKWDKKHQTQCSVDTAG